MLDLDFFILINHFPSLSVRPEMWTRPVGGGAQSLPPWFSKIYGFKMVFRLLLMLNSFLKKISLPGQILVYAPGRCLLNESQDVSVRGGLIMESIFSLKRLNLISN